MNDTRRHDPQIAFALGALAGTRFFAKNLGELNEPHVRMSLALRRLQRAWDHYREDRAISLGRSLLSVEATAERNAFLTLLDSILGEAQSDLRTGIKLVSRIAPQPLKAERKEADAITERSTPALARVQQFIAETIAQDPLVQLMRIISVFNYSEDQSSDLLTATSKTHCWAINLVALGQGLAFARSLEPISLTGCLSRKVFRADISETERRALISKSLVTAAEQDSLDIVRLPVALQRFQAACPGRRSNSRLLNAWLLLFAFGQISAADLARALKMTQPGARSSLRQLVAARLCRHDSQFGQYISLVSGPRWIAATD